MMKKYSFLFALVSALLFPLQGLAQQESEPASRRIIIDDVMMLTTAAVGLETLACCPYPRTRTINVAAGRQTRIDWADGRHYGRDTLRVIRLEILKDKALVAQFTLTLKPRQKPMVMQCMKGFGCAGAWEAYPWKSPNGNYLEHPQHKFRVTPGGASFFTVQNLDNKIPITIRVNPCETPVVKKEKKPGKPDKNAAGTIPEGH